MRSQRADSSEPLVEALFFSKSGAKKLSDDTFRAVFSLSHHPPVTEADIFLCLYLVCTASIH